MIQKFSFEKTSIDGLFLIDPFVVCDKRGSFTKDYSLEVFGENGIKHELKEVFYTKSHRGVIRGLHFQREKQQAKLVRCVFGKIYDVIVDLRKNSKTFACWQGFCLSEESQQELCIPSGCGHGFLAIEPSVVSYKCNEDFYGEYDDGILWNDKELDIKWPLSEINCEIILSDKDKSLQSFNEFKKEYGGLK